MAIIISVHCLHVFLSFAFPTLLRFLIPFGCFVLLLGLEQFFVGVRINELIWLVFVSLIGFCRYCFLLSLSFSNTVLLRRQSNVSFSSVYDYSVLLCTSRRPILEIVYQYSQTLKECTSAAFSPSCNECPSSSFSPEIDGTPSLSRLTVLVTQI